jgi:hypothetical protein
MSFIYMPPKFLSPYSGTELGSSGNVFCKQVSTTNGGVGTVVSPPTAADGSTPVTLTTTGSSAGSPYTTGSIPASSTTSASGTGFTAFFTVVKSGGGAQSGQAITLNISASGTGYVAGDTVTFSLADLAAVFDAVSGLSSSAATAPIVFTFAAGSGNSLTIYGNVGETGWQTTLPAVSANAQLLSIVIPDDGVDTNDFADANYVVVCNLTGGVAETLAASVGTVSASIHHDGTLNTDTVTVRRGSPVGLSALAAADITVRLVRRQLSVA